MLEEDLPLEAIREEGREKKTGNKKKAASALPTGLASKPGSWCWAGEGELVERGGSKEREKQPREKGEAKVSRRGRPEGEEVREKPRFLESA